METGKRALKLASLAAGIVWLATLPLIVEKSCLRQPKRLEQIVATQAKPEEKTGKKVNLDWIKDKQGDYEGVKITLDEKMLLKLHTDKPAFFFIPQINESVQLNHLQQKYLLTFRTPHKDIEEKIAYIIGYDTNPNLPVMLWRTHEYNPDAIIEKPRGSNEDLLFKIGDNQHITLQAAKTPGFVKNRRSIDRRHASHCRPERPCGS